jgi:DHA2 family multidrug resistance protein
MSGSAFPPLSGFKLVVAAIVLSLGNFMVVLDTTITNVAMPTISGYLGVSTTEGIWIITAYAVAEAITVPLTGWLAMQFGQVRVFLFSVVAFVIFSVCCGLSWSLPSLAIFRVLQGLAGGPLIPFFHVAACSLPEETGQHCRGALGNDDGISAYIRSDTGWAYLG